MLRQYIVRSTHILTPHCRAYFPVQPAEMTILETKSVRLRSSQLLFCAGAWVPRNNQDQWIEADLQTIHRIESVTTKGRPVKKLQWVTSYYVSYSQDGTNWEEIPTLFEANKNRKTKKTNLLPDTIEARYIRLSPNSWVSRIAMRFEVTGCAVKG